MTDQTDSSISPFSYYHRLQRLKDYVDRHYADDIGLNDAARIAHLDAKYFSAYFRQKTGLTFRDWLSGERIARAQEMMECQDHSVTDIAYAVGFRDLRTFQRSFKRHTGVTPRAYKRSVRP